MRFKKENAAGSLLLLLTTFSLGLLADASASEGRPSSVVLAMEREICRTLDMRSLRRFISAATVQNFDLLITMQDMMGENSKLVIRSEMRNRCQHRDKVKILSEFFEGNRAVVKHQTGSDPAQSVVLIREGGLWKVEFSP